MHQTTYTRVSPSFPFVPGYWFIFFPQWTDISVLQIWPLFHQYLTILISVLQFKEIYSLFHCCSWVLVPGVPEKKVQGGLKPLGVLPIIQILTFVLQASRIVAHSLQCQQGSRAIFEEYYVFVIGFLSLLYPNRRVPVHYRAHSRLWSLLYNCSRFLVKVKPLQKGL